MDGIGKGGCLGQNDEPVDRDALRGAMFRTDLRRGNTVRLELVQSPQSCAGANRWILATNRGLISRP